MSAAAGLRRMTQKSYIHVGKRVQFGNGHAFINPEHSHPIRTKHG